MSSLDPVKLQFVINSGEMGPDERQKLIDHLVENGVENRDDITVSSSHGVTADRLNPWRVTIKEGVTHLVVIEDHAQLTDKTPYQNFQELLVSLIRVLPDKPGAAYPKRIMLLAGGLPEVVNYALNRGKNWIETNLVRNSLGSVIPVEYLPLFISWCETYVDDYRWSEMRIESYLEMWLVATQQTAFVPVPGLARPQYQMGGVPIETAHFIGNHLAEAIPFYPLDNTNTVCYITHILKGEQLFVTKKISLPEVSSFNLKYREKV